MIVHVLIDACTDIIMHICGSHAHVQADHMCVELWLPLCAHLTWMRMCTLIILVFFKKKNVNGKVYA